MIQLYEDYELVLTNIAVVNDVYLRQVKQLCIPSINFEMDVRRCFPSTHTRSSSPSSSFSTAKMTGGI